MSIFDSPKFKELLKDRRDWVDVNNRENNQHDLTSLLTNLYSDSSHFIFELLQNAEDAKAKNVKFTLTSEEFRIWHDGDDFTVDDIISITSINKSTKTADFTKIGEHGVGFKSVLALTKSPIINSGGIKFEINDIVYPNIISTNSIGDKTEIILPFNRDDHEVNDVKQIVSNIYNRLRNLSFRNVLFLNNIQKIDWVYEGDNGRYTKITENNYKEHPVSKREITYSRLIKNEHSLSSVTYLVFSKILEIDNKELQTDIAYQLTCIDGLDKIQPINNSKVCVFFETEHQTHLNFLVQAMFSTTSTRERIPLNPENIQNIEILNHAGDISADSLEILKSLNLLDINLLKMLPLQGNPDNIIVDIMFKKIKAKFCSDIKLLPNKFGLYGNKNDSMLAEASWIIDLLDKDQCYKLFEKPYFIENLTPNTVLYNYFKNDIGLEVIDGKFFSKSLTKDFLESQSDNWLTKFYLSIRKSEALWNTKYESPPLNDRYIIRAEDGKHYNLIDKNGDEAIYIYQENISHQFPIIRKCFCDDKDSLDFLKKLGASEFNQLAFIKKNILNLYKTKEGEFVKPTIDEFRKHIRLIIDYSNELKEREDDTSYIEFQKLIKERMLFPADFNQIGKEQNFRWAPVTKLYFPDNRLKNYFKDSETAIGFVKQLDLEEIDGYLDFLDELGITKTLRPIKIGFELNEKNQLVYKIVKAFPTQLYDNEDDNWTFIDLELMIDHMTPEISSLLWDSLKELNKKHILINDKNYFNANFWYNYYSKRLCRTDSKIIDILKSNSWIYRNSASYEPSELVYTELDESLYILDEFSESLIKELNFKEENKISQELLDVMSKDDQDQLKLMYELKEAGISQEEIRSFLDSKKQERRKPIDQIEKENLEEIYANRTDLTDLSMETSDDTVVINEKNQIRSDNENQNKPTRSDERLFDIESNLKRSIASDRTQISNLYDMLDRKESLETLLNYRNEVQKYTYEWFRLFLQIEYQSAKQNRDNNKSFKIHFSLVKRLSEKILLLKNPSINLPSFIEDLPRVSLTIRHKNNNKNVKVDVVSLRDNAIKCTSYILSDTLREVNYQTIKVK